MAASSDDSEEFNGFDLKDLEMFESGHVILKKLIGKLIYFIVYVYRFLFLVDVAETFHKCAALFGIRVCLLAKQRIC